MSFHVSLPLAERVALAPYLESVTFEAGERILEQGTPGDECYLLDEGRARLELHSAEYDTDAVLDYLEAGQLLGEFSLFDGAPRSASAYADTAVSARRLSRARFQQLCGEQPSLGNLLLTYMAQDFTHKLRHMDQRLGEFIHRGQAPLWVDEMVARAAAAQAEFADWPEERVDALLGDLARQVAAQATSLGADEVAETGLGVVEHKVQKIALACQQTLDLLLGQCAAGPRRASLGDQVTEILCPVGVVVGLIPLTNPVPTVVFKSLISLKSRNALILSCHRKALGVGGRVGALIQEVLRAHGAGPDLVQWIRERGSRATTAAFMTHPRVSLILATGGPSMVKAAYSSGTPAIGVGAGNAPVWVCADADPVATARTVIASKSFDNGVICGSDNNLVVDDAVHDAFVAALQAEGAVVLGRDEVDQFTAQVIDAPTAHLRADLVGRSPEHILQVAGLAPRPGARLIVVPVDRADVGGPWGHEKLAPVISLFRVGGEADGLALCHRILANMGAGHTAIIHTFDSRLALRFAQEMPASRVLQNCAGSTGCIGVGNGLQHSWTLGCGTWGGTSTTDNIGYAHLLNIKRLAPASAVTAAAARG